MKQIFLVWALFIASTGYVNAQDEWHEVRDQYTGMLKVSRVDHYPITVAVDGRHYKKHGESLTIGHLPRGKHDLRIYTISENDGGDLHAHLVFEGRIRIRAGELTMAVLDDNTGDLDVSQAAMPDINRNYEPEQRDGEAMPEPEGIALSQKQAPAEEKAVAAEQAPKHAMPKPEKTKTAPVSKEKPAYPLLTKDSQSKLAKAVSDKITDTDKLKVMQNALAKKAMKTSQLKQMMGWLNFESSRVELAKWAYNHTVDKENFSVITSQFSYQESKDEMKGYINGK